MARGTMGGLRSPIAIALHSSLNNAASQASYAFPSLTYEPKRLYVLFAVVLVGTGTAPIVTSAAGTTISFTEIGTAGGQTFNTGARRLQAFRCMLASQKTEVVTISLDKTSAACQAILIEADNVPTTGDNGADAIVQSITSNAGDAVVTGITLSMATFGHNNNRPIAVFSTVGERDIDPEAGYTELIELDRTTTGGTTQAEYHPNDKDNTPSVTWVTSARAAGFGLEIAHG